MARPRFNNTILGNPRVGIDVGFFDRKALEKQQRHDVARETYSKFAQGVADKAFLDPEAKEQYLKQQQTNFDEVLNKHAGNLSAGFQDIMGAIETSKSSPYHNLNRRQVEQDKVRQALMTKYGAKAIDRSNINQPLYKTVDGKVEWTTDPSDIRADVVEADNYSKIVEDMLAQTAAMEFTNQTGLTGGSGDPFYLMSKITKGEVLSHEDLFKISSNPAVQQAFLSNATTAGIDNRINPATGKTYAEMFNDPNQLAAFIYGNIQDKHRNNIHEQKQFKQNVSAVESYRHNNKKKEIAHEQFLKNYYVRPLVSSVDVGVNKINMGGLNNIVKDIGTNQKVLNDVKADINQHRSNFSEILGPGQTMDKYVTPDGKFNRNLAQQFLEINSENTGLDLNKIPDILNNLEFTFKKTSDLMQEENEFQRVLNKGTSFRDNIYNNISNKFYKNLSDKDKKVLEEEEGITDAKGLLELAKTSDYSRFSDDVGDLLNFRVDMPSTRKHDILGTLNSFVIDELGKGVEVDVLERGRVSSDPKSIEFQYGNEIKKIASELGFNNFISSLQNNSGNNILENHSGGNINDLGQTLEEFIEENPNLTEENMSVIFPDKFRKGSLMSHIILKGEKGKEYTIVNANLDDRNNLSEEITSRLVHQGQSHALSETYDKADMENRFHAYGSNRYGEEASNVKNHLKYSNSGNSMYLPIKMEDGSPSRTLYSKLDDGYMAIIGGNNQNKIFSDDPDELYNKSITDVGRMLYMYNNPKFGTNLKFHPDTRKRKGVRSNIQK